MKYIATLNGKKYEIEIEKVPDYQPLSHDQVLAPITTVAHVPTPTVKPTPASAPAVAAAPAPVTPAPAPAGAGETQVLSPMPGSIFDMKITEGQRVTSGQTLFVLEAMKMENEIVSPVDGIATSVLVKKGDMVDTDDILVIIK